MSTFRPIMSTTHRSINQLIGMSIGIDLLVGKMNNAIMGFISLNNSDEDRALSSVSIRVDKPIEITLDKGVSVEREIERVIGQQSPGASTGGRRFMIPVNSPAVFVNLTRAMSNGDYVRFRIVPNNSVLPRHPGYTKEANDFFCSGLSYSFCFTASNRLIAEALISDLRTTGATFIIEDEIGNLHSRKIGGNIITDQEVHCITQGIDAMCAELFPMDIHTVMSPYQLVNMDKPQIILGCNSGAPVGLRYSDLLTNLAIVGLSGSGKTTIECRVISALREAKIPVIVIAPLKHDFSAAFPDCDLYRAGDNAHPLRFNVLDFPNTSKAISLASSALTQIIPVSADSWLPMMYEMALTGLFAASDGEPISLADLAVGAANEFDLSGYTGNRESHSMKQALLNRPKSAYLKDEFNCARSNVSFTQMFEPGRLTVVELHDMEDQSRRTFATVFLQRLVQAYRSAPIVERPGYPRFVIVFDELHELLSENHSTNDTFRSSLNSSLETARGMGVAHILCDQRLDLLGEIATHGCSNHIVLNHPATEQAANMLTLSHNSELISLMPYYKQGEGLLHVTHQRTIPFDGNDQQLRFKGTLPGSHQTKTEQKAYRPYPTCDSVCSDCDYKLHRASFEAVAGQLSGASSSYREYVEAMKTAKANSDQVKRNNGIYQAKSKLLQSCVTLAIKKAALLGVDCSAKRRALEHCVKCELQRQKSFLVKA